MSGHSKWASIKHKKGALDAKRGKLFTKIIREITVAARAGGGNPDMNPTLRLAISKAKAANMPADNIERGIKKGTGELPGVSYEEVTYEGYGPGGVAVLVEALTDNKNRTTADVRGIFTKKGGNLAGAGSVNWIFGKKGFMTILKSDASEDKVMEVALENGAEDISESGDVFEITIPISDFEKVKSALAANNIKTQSAELTMIPTSSVALDGDKAKKALELVDALEDSDDVQNVYANFDIPDDLLDR